MFAANLTRSAVTKATVQTGFFAKIPNTAYYTPRRNMSIGSWIGDKVDGKKMEMQQHKERESFRHLRDYLISTPKYRFKEQAMYVESLLAKIGKTDRLIGGQDVKTQEELMKKKIDMYKAFTPLELLQESPVALNMAAKNRISLAAGVDRAKLTQELQEFDQTKTIHTWLHHRLKGGKTLPEHHIELQQLMRADPPPPGQSQLDWLAKQKAQSRRQKFR